MMRSTANADASSYLEETTRRACCERLGLDAGLVGEHFSATSEPIPSAADVHGEPDPETIHIRFGLSRVATCRIDPAVIAAELPPVRSH